jgi:hypothetical protein
MYVAAASAFFDFELMAHGSPSPPSVDSDLPAGGGSRKKPTSLPSAFFRSAVTQLPAIRKTPVPLPKACQAGS